MRASDVFVSFLLFICYGSSTGLPEPEAGLPISELGRLKRAAQGGKCETSEDCIAPNVCSKWGWCQWTKIYGEDGPSQGANAPGQGRSGQCVTSADCASRVPYCSKLGFCHGGRLPFDEEQLEIDPEVFETPVEDQPQGYINNNPAKNSPIVRNNKNNNGRRRQGQSQSRRGGSRPAAATTNNEECPTGNTDSCVSEVCGSLKVSISRVIEACEEGCRKRCQ